MQLFETGDNKTQRNRWLDRTGWGARMKGLDSELLQGLVTPIEDEPELHSYTCTIGSFVGSWWVRHKVLLEQVRR